MISDTQPPPPDLEFVMRLEVAIGPVIEIGATSQGQRRIIPITGGTFAGPTLSGAILPSGGDWQTVRPDGVADLHARYALQTTGGGLIEVDNRGYRHGPQAVLQQIAAGEVVDPGSYYFQTTPRFITAETDYDWLNRTIFIGVAQRFREGVLVDVFSVGRPR